MMRYVWLLVWWLVVGIIMEGLEIPHDPIHALVLYLGAMLGVVSLLILFWPFKEKQRD